MWPFKKPDKTKVFVFKGGIVTYDPDKVEVEFERSPEYDKAYKKGMDALDRLCVGEGCDKQSCGTHPPDTIESLINRLIELGEPKPEVVITGEKREGGKELYKATIDELHVLGRRTSSAYGGFRTTYELGSHEQSSCTTRFANTWCYNGFKTLAGCEKAIISILKDRLSRVVTETTTITY